MINVHGRGHWWWAYDSHAVLLEHGGRHVYRTGIYEVEAPYREGSGWAIRLGQHAIQAGRCTFRAVTKPQEALGGDIDIKAGPDEIRFWGRTDAEIEAWEVEFRLQHSVREHAARDAALQLALLDDENPDWYWCDR